MKILREMVRSTTMGIDAIDHVLPYAEDENLVRLMNEQKQSMKDMLCEAKKGLTRDEIKEAEGSKFAKTMLKAGSSFSAMMNSDTSHLARMLIEGYETGIVSMQKCLNEMRKAHEEAPLCAKDLIKSYDKNIKALRKYL